jgi:phospholipid-translocating ATPase
VLLWLDAECATPNADVYKFDSRLFLNAESTEAISMTSSNMLLQSTHLRNTDWVYGLAVYTGNETKCGMNKRDPPSKWTKADRFVNMTAVYIFGFQLLIVVVFGIVGNIWKDSTGRDSFYLNYYSKSEESWYQVLVIPLRFLLLCSLMIPISLKVTLDLARYVFHCTSSPLSGSFSSFSPRLPLSLTYT